MMSPTPPFVFVNMPHQRRCITVESPPPRKVTGRNRHMASEGSRTDTLSAASVCCVTRACTCARPLGTQADRARGLTVAAGEISPSLSAALGRSSPDPLSWTGPSSTGCTGSRFLPAARSVNNDGPPAAEREAGTPETAAGLLENPPSAAWTSPSFGSRTACAFVHRGMSLCAFR